MVDDETVEHIIRERLGQHNWNFGFILDGFPRTKTQAEFFLESYDIDAVIHIAVPDEVVFERVLARRLCSQCGLDYNLIHHRPAIADTCDVCGGKLTIRSDDNEEGLRQRLRDYRTQTEPVLELFGRKELVIQTNGALGIDEIRADIRAQLGLRKTK